MKTSLIFFAVFILNSFAFSQFPFINAQSVYWNSDGSFELQAEFTPSIAGPNTVFGGGTWMIISGPTTLNPNPTFDLSQVSINPNIWNVQFVWFEYPSVQTLHIDPIGLVRPNLLNVYPPSTCNGNDAQICYPVTGMTFSVNGTPSINGCVQNLTGGQSYTVIFDPYLSPIDGRTHYNNLITLTLDIPALNIDFSVVGNDLTASIIGGTEPYNWEIFGPIPTGPNTPVPNFESGCYTLTVTDATGCAATVSAFVPQTCMGDMNADGFVNVADLMLFLQENPSGNPSTDYDCNGVYDTGDMLLFLLNLATSC